MIDLTINVERLSFEEYFSLKPHGENMTEFTIRLKARPLTLGMRLYVALFSKTLDARLGKFHERIVGELMIVRDNWEL